MSFADIQFPPEISLQSGGGPSWDSIVVRMDSGHEQRNQAWAEDLGRWEVSFMNNDLPTIQSITAFFHARRGKIQAFRFKDWFDFEASGEIFGTGDGTTAIFPLATTRAAGADMYAKRITKPIHATVTIYVDDIAQTEDVNYTLSDITGEVTFLAGHIPASDAVLTWDGEFDKPARFDTDILDISYVITDVGSIVRLPIVECRL